MYWDTKDCHWQIENCCIIWGWAGGKRGCVRGSSDPNKSLCITTVWCPKYLAFVEQIARKFHSLTSEKHRTVHKSGTGVGASVWVQPLPPLPPTLPPSPSSKSKVRPYSELPTVLLVSFWNMLESNIAVGLLELETWCSMTTTMVILRIRLPAPRLATLDKKSIEISLHSTPGWTPSQTDHHHLVHQDLWHHTCN